MVTDGTQVKQDVKTSVSTEETSKGATTFTKAEVDALVAKAKSDALAAAGRDAKGLSEIKKTVDSALAQAQLVMDRAEARQREIDQRELDAVKDDPDRLQILQEKQRVRAERAAFEADKAKKAAEDAQKDAEIAESRKSRRQQEIDAIVTAQNIEKSKLDDLIDDTTPIDRVARIAAALQKVATNTQKGDSGDNHGGTPATVWTIKQDYISGKINSIQYAEKMKSLGLTP